MEIFGSKPKAEIEHFFQELCCSQRGAAFILALMLVAAVGLLVTPLLYLTSSGVLATNRAGQRFMQSYAADAGVEDALWRIRYEGVLELGETNAYSRIYNDYLTDITIAPAIDPTPMVAPELTPIEPGGNMKVYEIVDPNFVEPCSEEPCAATQFIYYTIFLENYGTSNVHLDYVGTCLPLGFQFEQVEDVTGISFKKDASLEDDYELVWDDTDPPSCPKRWKVEWFFSPPYPNVGSGERGEIKFSAISTITAKGIYYSEVWLNPKPAVFGTINTPEAGPVLARFPEWDITSIAGGSRVESRTTILKDIEGDPIVIKSWQVN